MRVLIVSGIFPPDIGGPASYVPLLATELIRRNHRVSVITLADNPQVRGEFDYPVYRIRRRQWLPFRVLHTIWTVSRLAWRHDVVLANTLGFEAGFGAALTGRRCVHKVVGDYAWERARGSGRFKGTIEEYQVARKGLRLRLLDLWRNLPLRFAAVVVVPSIYLARIVTGWGVSALKVEVIYNATAREMYSKVVRTRKFSNGFIVISVCRLVSWKGVDGLLNAAARLPGVNVTIVGDGPLRSELEALSQRLDLAGRVQFTGHRPVREVSALLKSADVFVLNSSYEGLPHVIIEAMAAGIPVVAASSGGTPELVKHEETGLLVAANDTDSLVHALERLRSNEEFRTKLAINAQLAFEKHFTLDTMVGQTEAVLSRVADVSH